MMELTLHKLPEGFIVTSNEEIVSGDIVLVKNEYHNNLLRKFTTVFGGKKEDCKKVIAQQDQLDFSSLKEEKQKEIGWFDEITLAESNSEKHHYAFGQQSEFYQLGFIEGFQKAKELLSDRRFTVEDMKSFFAKTLEIAPSAESHARMISDRLYRNSVMDELFKSLSKPESWKIDGLWENNKFKITKIWN